jgi:hypothetical protein
VTIETEGKRRERNGGGGRERRMKPVEGKRRRTRGLEEGEWGKRESESQEGN